MLPKAHLTSHSRMSGLLVIREIQIETASKYHLTPFKMISPLVRNASAYLTKSYFSLVAARGSYDGVITHLDPDTLEYKVSGA